MVDKKRGCKICVLADLKPQLSLFDNSTCTQCGVAIEDNYVYCNNCAQAWVDKYLNVDQLENKKE
jgi:hypothetical protein